MAVEQNWLRDQILEAVPDAVIKLTDLTGARDHWEIKIVAASFDGVRMLERQRTILRKLKDYIPDPLHAIDIEARTPEEWIARGNDPLD